MHIIPGRHVILCGSTNPAHIRGRCSECARILAEARERDAEKKLWQVRAIARVSYAKRAGRLRRLDGSVPCADCGAPATIYDHRDYAKPLDVVPVCRNCNIKRGPAVWPSNESNDLKRTA